MKIKALEVAGKTILQKMGRSGLQLQKHSPKVLLVGGIVCLVGAAVWACKNTLKAHEVIDEFHENKEAIDTAKKMDIETYTDKDAKKDTLKMYGNTAFGFIKLYAGPIVLGAIGIACLVKGHNILNKRNIAIAGAYKALKHEYETYRKNVQQSCINAGCDSNCDAGYRGTPVPSEPDENGDVINLNGFKYSKYAKFFDESSIHWEKTPDYNYTFIKMQEQIANNWLQTRANGVVLLNEVYEMLGIPKTPAGAVVGWVRDSFEGDNYISFGLLDMDNENNRDFVNGYERSILLDFNVDGIVYELL